MGNVKKLRELGQSIWYDYIKRSFITSGEMQTLIDEGLGGMTSNPSIFEKAIAQSSDYDQDIKEALEKSDDPAAIFESLAVVDIAMAADLLRPVYDATNGHDGYVSLEVNPEYAFDTQKTISEAKRLFDLLERPNIMIKIPGTPEGLPAVTASLAAGININVTLIFSLENYKKVAEAYLQGLEQYLQSDKAKGSDKPLSKIASVASFFVSRIDTAVDEALGKINKPELQGKAAVANAKLAYKAAQEIFSGPRWEALATKGAQLQRVLWASTSTKNPAYNETIYVDELIGPDTVNTVPPVTYKALHEKATIKRTIDEGVEQAQAHIDNLGKLGIDFDGICDILQEKGVDQFAKAYKGLLESLAEKAKTMAVAS